jgi:hypothetical protein
MATTLEWICKNCEVPNVIAISENMHYTLTCGKCGAPGQIEQSHRPEHHVVCSTHAMPSYYSTNVASPILDQAFRDAGYAVDPSGKPKRSVHWRV